MEVFDAENGINPSLAGYLHCLPDHNYQVGQVYFSLYTHTHTHTPVYFHLLIIA